MNNIFHIILVGFILLFSSSCSKEKQQITTQVSSKQTVTKAVYNQAYQENYKKDSIPDIITQARDAYVLLDPFQDGVLPYIKQIKALNNEIGAYISIGTAETFRDDYKLLANHHVQKPWSQWKDEYFINLASDPVVAVMYARIDSIAEWGFDWVEFDNMDWAFDSQNRATYDFEITENQAIAYYQDLCHYARTKGLKCMAKNTVQKADDFDGVLYESYTDNTNWWDQNGTFKFINANKLVIINHYNESDCDAVLSNYQAKYNNKIAFICEDRMLKSYRHYQP